MSNNKNLPQTEVSTPQEIQALVIIKPEGAPDREVIIARLEQAGCRIITSEPARFATLTELHGHYAGIGQLKKRLTAAGKPEIYDAIIAHMMSGPIEPMILAVPKSFEAFDVDENGELNPNPDALVGFRNKVIGKTNPKEAAPGTIRGDLGAYVPAKGEFRGKVYDTDTILNVLHCSANREEAKQEISLWFGVCQ